jgi:hypothetical protein
MSGTIQSKWQQGRVLDHNRNESHKTGFHLEPKKVNAKCGSRGEYPSIHGAQCAVQTSGISCIQIPMCVTEFRESLRSMSRICFWIILQQCQHLTIQHLMVGGSSHILIRVLHQEGVLKAMNNPSLDSQCSGQDLYQAPPEYKARALPIHQFAQ